MGPMDKALAKKSGDLGPSPGTLVRPAWTWVPPTVQGELSWLVFKMCPEQGSWGEGPGLWAPSTSSPQFSQSNCNVPLLLLKPPGAWTVKRLEQFESR